MAAEEAPTTLHLAIKSGDVSACTALFQGGADPDGLDEHNFSPLMYAVIHRVEVVFELLLKRGVNLNAVNGAGDTALHFAAQKGSIIMTRALVAAGATPGVVNMHGNTPLHLSCFIRSVDVSVYLVQCGLSLDRVNNYSKTPLALGGDEFSVTLRTRIAQLQAAKQSQQQGGGGGMMSGRSQGAYGSGGGSMMGNGASYGMVNSPSGRGGNMSGMASGGTGGSGSGVVITDVAPPTPNRVKATGVSGSSGGSPALMVGGGAAGGLAYGGGGGGRSGGGVAMASPSAAPAAAAAAAAGGGGGGASPQQPRRGRTVPEPEERYDWEVEPDEVEYGKFIARGAFGEVFRGEFRGTDVAIKQLLEAKINDKALAEFRSEVAILSKLRHPNINLFMGACIRGKMFLLTAFEPRGSLYHVLHNPKIDLDWPRLIKMAGDGARGMAYLHGNTPSILHRDLKSLNLLVDENWRLKITDFGLTRSKEAATMTQCGTPQWMAPEVLRNENYDSKADVYSYGIVMWEMATRKVPYEGSNPMQVGMKVLLEGLRPEVPEYVPREYASLMTSMWDASPQNRPDFRAVLDTLSVMNI